MNNPKQLNIVTARELEDQTIIIDLNGKRMFHQLNQTASLIWKLCDGKTTVESIVLKLVQEYNVDSETAKNDVHETLKQLKDMQLIE